MRLWDERCSFSLLIFAAAVLAGRKVHRHLKLQWVARIAGLALVTLTLNWLLVAALNRKEAEPRMSPPDYPAPSATP
jgi:urease gamma subunit